MLQVALEKHLPLIYSIIERAIAAMNRQGIDQWDSVYPTRDDLREDVEQGHLYIQQLPASETVVGLVVLNQDQDPEYDEVSWIDARKPLVVHRLTVDPIHQGKGLATKMMKSVEQHARDGDYSSIRFDAFSRNSAACHLYQKMGYAKRGAIQFRKGDFYCYEKVL